MTHDGPDDPAVPMPAPDADGLRREIVSLQERNSRLTATLHEAKAQLLAMKEEIDRLAQPPSGLRRLPRGVRGRNS